MLLTSYGFLGFALLVLALYYLLPRKCQWPLLLIASCGFYALADWRYLFFIALTALSVWLIGCKMDDLHSALEAALAQGDHLSREEKKQLRAQTKARKWKWLLGGLLLNIGVLSVTKYTNFVLENIASLLSRPFSPIGLIVPMGVSFYTFQAVGYLIDVYRGRQRAQRNPFKFALFVSFFPQLVQGPISRYGDLSQTLFSPHPFEPQTVSFGLMRVAWGYFKKLVVADRLIGAVTTLVQGPQAYSGPFAFAAMLFYAFELYCDFTGGIDITIGLAQMMGIRIKENFDLPFFSKSTKEYWNRWHISMGSWFTDYIFYPVSVCGPMLRLSKWSRAHLPPALAKRLPVYLAGFLVWFTTGLWHGAAWNFIAWGLANFVVIMFSQELEPLYARFHRRFGWRDKPLWGAFAVVRTMLLMSCIRMFDCYRDVPLTLRMVGSMFTDLRPLALFDGTLLRIGLSGADYAVLLFAFAVILSVSLCKRKKGSVRALLWQRPFAFYGALALLCVACVIFGAYGVGYDSSQFIYNQF
ncbi:MAG: MBOAT family O-acyltransferase [Eubacteriales bacterium]|nr:MBOAT family O-acyltransferase [Eubacteriales bacterium]